jgi:tRNA (mo5U34)-methyltransferase
MRTLQSHGTAGLPQELSPWFHNLHLPGGLQTAPDHPLGDFPRFKWEQIGPALPYDLRGARALDIGCNAGFYSFELARRGAHVLAVDLDEHYLRQARWAAERLELADRVEVRRMSVYDLAGVPAGQFDVVLFLGVLYHLRHPLLALDIISALAGDLVVVQTLTRPGEPADTPADIGIGERERLLEPGWPKMAFIEHELAGDPTNWWAPDAGCVEAMLRSAGLEIRGRPAHETWLCARPSTPPAPWVRDELRAATGRADPRGDAQGHG